MDLKSPVHSAALALDIPYLPHSSGFPPPLMTPDSLPLPPHQYKYVTKSKKETKNLALSDGAESHLRLNPHCLRKQKAKLTEPPMQLIR